MDKFIEGLATVVKPPWNYILGVAALIIMGLPRVMDLRDSWLSSRSNMRELEYEKLQLEVLKLRRELQVSEKPEFVPYVPELAREFGTITIDPRPPVVAEIVAPTPAKQHPPGVVRRFVLEHPGPGRALMWGVQFLLAPLIALFGFATPGIVIAGWSDPEMGVGPSMVLALVYAGLTALSYWGFRSAGSIRKAAVARSG